VSNYPKSKKKEEISETLVNVSLKKIKKRKEIEENKKTYLVFPIVRSKNKKPALFF
jgi:hypothetical protein